MIFPLLPKSERIAAIEMDFSTKRAFLELLKEQEQIPRISGNEIAQEKLIHHTIKLDVNALLDESRKFL